MILKIFLSQVLPSFTFICFLVFFPPSLLTFLIFSLLSFTAAETNSVSRVSTMSIAPPSSPIFFFSSEILSPVSSLLFTSPPSSSSEILSPSFPPPPSFSSGILSPSFSSPLSTSSGILSPSFPSPPSSSSGILSPSFTFFTFFTFFSLFTSVTFRFSFSLGSFTFFGNCWVCPLGHLNRAPQPLAGCSFLTFFSLSSFTTTLTCASFQSLPCHIFPSSCILSCPPSLSPGTSFLSAEKVTGTSVPDWPENLNSSSTALTSTLHFCASFQISLSPTSALTLVNLALLLMSLPPHPHSFSFLPISAISHCRSNTELLEASLKILLACSTSSSVVSRTLHQGFLSRQDCIHSPTLNSHFSPLLLFW